MAEQLRLLRQRRLAALLTTERAPWREVLDEVGDLREGARRVGAAPTAREKPDAVLGLERCPQSALVMFEDARELQEEGLSAWKTSKTNSVALAAGTRPVVLSRSSSRIRR